MQDLTRVCYKCKLEKDSKEFIKDKRRKDGFCNICKPCNRNRNINYRENNADKLQQYHILYYKDNSQKIKDYQKRNPEKLKKASSIWRKKNIDKVNAIQERYIKKLPDSYIKTQLKVQNYPQELINNPEFIEVKRLIIKTKRLCRTSRN